MFARKRRKSRFLLLIPLLISTTLAAPTENSTDQDTNPETNSVDPETEYEVKYNSKYGINPSWQIGDQLIKDNHVYTVHDDAKLAGELNNLRRTEEKSSYSDIEADIKNLNQSIMNMKPTEWYFAQNLKKKLNSSALYSQAEIEFIQHLINKFENKDTPQLNSPDNVTPNGIELPNLDSEDNNTSNELTNNSQSQPFDESKQTSQDVSQEENNTKHNETTTEKPPELSQNNTSPSESVGEGTGTSQDETTSSLFIQNNTKTDSPSTIDTITSNSNISVIPLKKKLLNSALNSTITSDENSAKTSDENSAKISDENSKLTNEKSAINRSLEEDPTVPVFTELDYDLEVQVPEDYYDLKDQIPTAAPNTDAISVLLDFAGSVAESVAERVLPKTIFDIYKRMQKQSEAIEADRLRSREENGGLGQFGRGILKTLSSGITRPLNQLMAARDIGSLDSDRGFVSGLASGVAGVADNVANVASTVAEAFKDRVQAIYPGTLWCGDGHSATARSKDLGLFFLTDTCCRQHDACKLFIKAGETRFGLTNTGLFTRSHCVCDQSFRSCLKQTNSLVSSQIGLTFFNVLGPQCFRKAHPIVRCVRRTRITGQKCEEYQLDYTKPKMWQWFDSETF